MIARYILLAEDNSHDAELTIAALREGKVVCPIERMADGAEALDFLFRRGTYASRTSGPPALILLDIKMPKVDGLEVLKVIKSDPVLRVIPVVMLTSSREDSDLMKCYSYGVNAFVVKPVDFLDFMTAVRELGQFWGVINEPSPIPAGS